MDLKTERLYLEVKFLFPQFIEDYKQNRPEFNRKRSMLCRTKRNFLDKYIELELNLGKNT